MSAKEILEQLRKDGKTNEADALEKEINGLISESATYRMKNKEFKDFLGLDDTANLTEVLSKKSAEANAKKLADEEAEKKRIESLSEKDQLLESLKKSNESTQAILKQIQEEKEQAKKEARNQGLKNTLHSEFDKLRIRPELKSDALDLVAGKVKDLGDRFVLNIDGQDVEIQDGLTKFFDARKHYIADTQAQGANTTNTQTPANTNKVAVPTMPFARNQNQKILDALKGDK